MKQNKIKKYSLMTLFLLIGLFGINSNVHAEALTCNYSFDFTYEHTTSKGIIVSDNGTADFQLIVDNSDKASGWENYTKYQLKVTGSHSIVPRYPVGPSNKTVYIDSPADQCPAVTIYQRRAGLTGINNNKFYILSENEKSYNETASDLINACNGKDADEEVLSGYRCGNIIGQISGILTDDKSSNTSVDDGFCSEEQEKQILQKRKDLYEEIILKEYYNWRGKLERAALVFNTSHDKSVCDAYMEIPDDALNSAMTNYSKQYTDYLSFQNCNSDKVNGTAGFETATEGYIRQLIDYRTQQKNECIKTANDLTLPEQTQAIQENYQENQKMEEELLEQNEQNFNKMVDLINGLDLGGPVAVNCEGLFGDDLLDLIKKLLNYVQIAAPILLLILGSVDFGQAVLADDKDALKKATSKFVKRAIICVAIFFLPYIINYLLSFIDGMSKDPLCGIK